MKSIMEEASTVAKAIENAWNRAGQPQEFSVKILEHPKTSFFGLKTAKSAKIALLFDETKIKEQPAKQARPVILRPQQSARTDQSGERSNQQRRPQSPAEKTSHENRPQGRQDQRRPMRSGRPEHPADRQQQPPRTERPEQRPYEQRPPAPRHTSDFAKTAPDRHDENRETWTPEMVDAARDWLKETLVLMGKPEIRVEPYVSHNYLKLYLDRPVLEDPRQEETQLKSWGSLAMEAVREKANKPLRNLRIILEGKK